MDSDEEFLQFSGTENFSPSPAPDRKLKRLKKGTGHASPDPLPNPSNEDLPLVDAVNFSKSEALDGEEKGEHSEELSMRTESQSEGFEEGNEVDSGFDGLENDDGGSGAKRGLEFDSVVEGLDDEGGDRSKSMELDDKSEDVGVEFEDNSEDLGVELEKKKHKNSGGVEGKEGKKKIKKRSESDGDGFDEIPYSIGSSKKERRDRLKELRVESQKLLRETRDVSFKPMPLVQKPISSVLEKIRQRKREVSEKLVKLSGFSLVDGNGAFSRLLDFDYGSDSAEDIEDVTIEKLDNDEKFVPPIELESKDAPTAEGHKDAANHSHKDTTLQMALDEESKQTFQGPTDDTQDLIFNSQAIDSKDDLQDDVPSSPLEEVMAPSVLAMNLKLGSSPLDDSLSDEEDNDKENTDPHLHRSIDLSSLPNGDPVKAFVDEEAEEEDDSDNDLCQFQDNEEVEDDMDSEELNDIIATGYEEKPIDNEMRNQLHQKWLEQQDAAGTENLLQKLKCGSKHRETVMLEEKEDEEIEENREESLDEDAGYPLPKNIVRMNLKKAKEMIPQMFTDKDDVYISSDDEETEKNLVKHRLSDQTEEQATFMSPAEDKGSKDIFGLIKKLNSAPETRKKAKVTAFSNTLTIGGNRSVSSKSSFLGRGSKNSLPSFQRCSTSTVRSFVFEREDSSRRETMSTSGDSSDLIQRENRPRKASSVKLSSSQIRNTSTQTTQTAAAEMKSGPSLHEILRCPTLKSGHSNGDTMVGQVEAIYAAFKMDQNLIKKQPGVSVRSI